jgi:AraC family transcriptional regulator, arabinose operon regulatory protein
LYYRFRAVKVIATKWLTTYTFWLYISSGGAEELQKESVYVLLCGYSYHTVPYLQSYRNGVDSYIFRLQTEGVCTIDIEGETKEARPGDLTLLAPGTRYDLLIGSQDGENQVSPASSGDYYVFCEGAWIEEWWGRKERPAMSRIIGAGRLLGIWNQLVLEKRSLDGGDPELSATLLMSLCLMLDRALEEVKPPEERRTSFLAVRIRHYIEEHALQPLRLEDVARHAGLSVSRTVHLFKDYYQDSIVQYVTKIRLSMAIELMRCSAMTLEQVAEASGFGGYPYFHRVFRSRYGMSPGAYRRDQSLGR